MGGLLDLFSSVRLGVISLAVLFVYLTIGSAGLFYPSYNPVSGIDFTTYMVRQHRVFEMTEFEWFHTWFFYALVALICVNLIVATLRRIPFNTLKLGVWMIHSGMIILAVGSVIYFGTKVEGDTPVFRRQVVITGPGGERTSFTALPGAVGSLQTERGEYFFQVAQVDPNWPILSGEDEGKQAYSVSVAVTPPGGEPFVRQMLAGYPQYTEDIIPGEGRAVRIERFGGEKIVDTSIDLGLDYAVQEYFWVKDSSALKIRPAGTREWQQRTIVGLPRYNDYLSPGMEVASEDGSPLPDYPIDKVIPDAPDALEGIDVRVTGYLRYAQIMSEVVDGGDELEPVVDVQIVTDQGVLPERRLWAMDPFASTAFERRLKFEWVEDEAELAELREPYGRMLTLKAEGMDEPIEVQVTQAFVDEGENEPFVEIADSGWSYRVTSAIDQLPIEGMGDVSGLILEFRSPEGETFTRWVFEDAALTRDLEMTEGDEEAHPMSDLREEIESTYTAGRWAVGTIVAGPGDIGLRVLLGGDWQEVDDIPLEIGVAEEVFPGQKLVVTRLIERARERVLPVVVPESQRNRDADVARRFALMRVTLSQGDWEESHWLPFHKYSFESMSDHTRTLSIYMPTTVELPSGERVDLMFSREKQELPAPVVLEDFIVTARVGGFQGTVSTVRDWTSIVRFKQDDGSWSDTLTVSTNNPKENRGFWYFQSFWEPPRSPSAQDPGTNGLNFTGLGVGNRNGVYTQLAGCCISVFGMIWAWYIKPIIKRRRRDKVLEEHAEVIAEKTGEKRERDAVLVGAGEEAGS